MLKTLACRGLRVGPSKALQTGFGLANFGIIADKFLSKFLQRISPATFSALFLQGFRPRPKIHAQNSLPKLPAFLSNFSQESPRQTKPKKGQLMNFSRGQTGTKVRCELRLLPKEKHQNSQKWAKFMNFSFWPFLWFGVPGRLLIQ